MLVEGTLRWRVTEDCPLDLLVALCLRDLAGLTGAGDPALPSVVPAVKPVGALLPARTGSEPILAPVPPASAALAREWTRWWRRAVIHSNSRGPWHSEFVPPHFAAFDRELALQDLVLARFAEASAWAAERRAEYLADERMHHTLHAADIVEIVRGREHELRRQAGSFRLDIEALPLASPGAWIVGPDTVVISWSLREDHDAFRTWLRQVVAALV